MYNLTNSQKELISAIVGLVREGKLNENFTVLRDGKGGMFVQNKYEKTGFCFANTDTQSFDALARAQLLIVDVVEPRFGVLNCSLTGYASEAVDSNFAAPDTSLTNKVPQFSIGSVHMGDNYSAGQVGAMGPSAHSHDSNFDQVTAQQIGQIDMRTLAAELSSLRHEMRQAASEPQHDIAVGQIAAAEAAAQSGDANAVLRHLRTAGK